MSPRAEAHTARILQAAATGGLIAEVRVTAWSYVLLLTVTILISDRWAHHARRVAARPTHRRTA